VKREEWMQGRGGRLLEGAIPGRTRRGGQFVI
jgi:hypothetical protein